MKSKWKLLIYVISTFLCTAAMITIYCVWSPFFITTNAAFPDSGIEVPMRAVGVNMPAGLVLGIGLVMAALILFLLLKRKRLSTGLIWVNAIAILIIVFNVIVLMTWTHPEPDILYENDKYGFSLLIPNDFEDVVEIREGNNGVYFVDTEIQAIHPQFMGQVGRIEVYDKAVYDEACIYENADIYGLKYLGENGKYYFGWAHATDVQVPTEASQEMNGRFRVLEEKFNEIMTTFKIIDISNFDIDSQKEYITDNFYRSVTYAPAQNLLSFTIPVTIPENYRFYLHVSGTMFMGNQSERMSFHAFDDESENYSWEKGKTYTYALNSENLDEILLVFGLIDSSNNELLHTITIASDGTKNLDKTTQLLCFIKSYNEKSKMLTFDEIEWVMQTDAKRVNELGLDAELDFPDGYYIYNKTKQQKSITVADDVKVYLVDWGRDLAHPTLTDMGELTNRMKDYEAPYHLTIKDGVIVEILEQYRP